MIMSVEVLKRTVLGRVEEFELMKSCLFVILTGTADYVLGEELCKSL